MPTQTTFVTVLCVCLLTLGCSDGNAPEVVGGGNACTPSVGDPPELHAGFRSSRYGVDPFPTPEWWTTTATTYAAGMGGATPAGVWLVGTINDDGTCHLTFPAPATAPATVTFSDTDLNEEYLAYFDQHGVKVWLQVEPGNAAVSDLMDLVLAQYGQHPSVIGFGVDVEWYQYSESVAPTGTPVTDAEAEAWVTQARGFDPSYTVFVKHWETGFLPPTARDGLMFISDSQEVTSRESLVAEFEVWGCRYAPAPVGFQIGYDPDRSWWSNYQNPPVEIGQAIVEAVPNTGGLFWVDFTITEVFPP
jgi:hypothetical protein